MQTEMQRWHLCVHTAGLSVCLSVCLLVYCPWLPLLLFVMAVAFCDLLSVRSVHLSSRGLAFFQLDKTNCQCALLCHVCT